MALIAMAVYSTAENKKDVCLVRTLRSLVETVDFSRHRLILSVNGLTDQTAALLLPYHPHIDQLIVNGKNLGTAEAINKAWQFRKPGEHCIKMDDDVVIYEKNWANDLEEAIRRDPLIGIAGLKRKDCWENTEHENPFYRSKLYQLPHQPGEKWMIAEQVNHVMGTCQLYSDALLQKIGYLYQPKLYGFDDSFAALRCQLAGFKNVFIPHIEIDHIDPGDTPYQKWKEGHASECWEKYHQIVAEYKNGTRSIYYNPFANNKAAIV